MGFSVHGVPVEAPPLDGTVVFDQRWLDLAFLHWPVDPARVAQWFPPGTRPDTVDGVTYVGLVPFTMRKAGPGRGLPVPYFGDFLEVNVRLYSVDAQGRHGVVFRSLDCTRGAVVALARCIGVPYVWSAISADGDAEHRDYRVTRRRGGVTSRIAWTVGAPTEPTDLELFLTSRWGMHSALAGRGLWTPNHHGPWPLFEAEPTGLSDDLVAAAGVEPAGPMLRMLYSPGVHARFGRPVRVRD